MALCIFSETIEEHFCAEIGHDFSDFQRHICLSIPVAALLQVFSCLFNFCSRRGRVFSCSEAYAR